MSDGEILTVFENADERWLRTEQAADELPISIDALAERLDDLHERDLLARADDDLPGERWRLGPGASDERTGPEAEVETDVEAQATKVTGTETAPRAEETPETPPPDPQEEPLDPARESPEDAIDRGNTGSVDREMPRTAPDEDPDEVPNEELDDVPDQGPSEGAEE